MVRVAGLALLLMLCAPLRAEVVEWLYSVTVPVESQNNSDRADAAGRALRQVVTRVSGVLDLPNSSRLRLALAQTERFYSQFSYARDPVTDALQARFEFDSDAVIDLCQALELPVWWANRPRLLLWALDDAGRTLGEPDPAALEVESEALEPGVLFASALKARARERGIPLVLPSADADGEIDAPLRGIARYELSALTPYAARYQAEVMSAGRFGAGVGELRGRWQVWLDDAAVPISVRASDAAELGQRLADQLADLLASRYAVTGQVGELRLSVADVVTPRQYAALLRYLGSLEFVESAAIVELRDGIFYLQLQTQATPDKLLELFAVDGLLGPGTLRVISPVQPRDPFGNSDSGALPSAPTPTPPPVDLATRWLGVAQR